MSTVLLPLCCICQHRWGYRSETFTAPVTVTAAATLLSISVANGRQNWCAVLCKTHCLALEEGRPLMCSSSLSLVAGETCCWKYCHKSQCSCWGTRADVMLSWMLSVTWTTGGSFISGHRTEFNPDTHSYNSVNEEFLSYSNKYGWKVQFMLYSVALSRVPSESCLPLVHIFRI